MEIIIRTPDGDVASIPQSALFEAYADSLPKTNPSKVKKQTKTGK